ncbi:ankyrin repeat protein [Nemania abortiva]|nr:ankyrin repeat protein [Nemania abortiva]
MAAPTKPSRTRLHGRVSTAPIAGNESVTCNECGRLCKSLKDLQSHKRVHQRIFPCPEKSCDRREPEKSFTTRRDLARHQDHVHGKKSMQCLYCLKRLKRSDNLPRHVIQAHGEEVMATAVDEDKAIITRLLDKRANVKSKRGSNKKLLLQMAESGREAIVKLLLSMGIDIESAESYRGRTPLIRAVDMGHIAVVELLLMVGANIEANDYKIGTSLIYAARNGHAAIAEMLLSKGADIQVWAGDGVRPLMSAAENGHTAVVELLLNKGAEIWDTDFKGRNAIDKAATNGHTAVVELLRSKRASGYFPPLLVDSL